MHFTVVHAIPKYVVLPNSNPLHTSSHFFPQGLITIFPCLFGCVPLIHTTVPWSTWPPRRTWAYNSHAMWTRVDSSTCPTSASGNRYVSVWCVCMCGVVCVCVVCVWCGVCVCDVCVCVVWCVCVCVSIFFVDQVLAKYKILYPALNSEWP